MSRRTFNLATGQPRVIDRFQSDDWMIKKSKKKSGRPSDDVQSGEFYFYFRMGNVSDSSPIN